MSENVILNIIRPYLERLQGKAEFIGLNSKELEHLEKISKIMEAAETNQIEDNEFRTMPLDDLKKIAKQYSQS